MELDAVELAIVIGDRSVGGIIGMGENLEACGELHHRIPVAHPHGSVVFDVGEQIRGIVDVQCCLTVLPAFGPFHRTAQLLHHQLHSVANPQNRNPQFPNPGIAMGRAGIVHGVGSTREDNPFGFELAQLFGGGAIGQHFRVDLGFANSTGDQFRILGTEVQNNDQLAVSLESGFEGVGGGIGEGFGSVSSCCHEMCRFWV